MSKNTVFVVAAAGGNNTVIRILSTALSRAEYESIGRKLITETEIFGAEQCGFLILDEGRFEMSEGGFCGNAARAAAVLFSKFRGTSSVHFTMSGYRGMVRGNVVEGGDDTFAATCTFPGLPNEVVRETFLDDGRLAKIDRKSVV